MAYTNIWNENKLTGGEPANILAALINSVRVDLQDRLQDIFAIPDFTVDPLRPYGLKLTDAQDAVINLGDNGGPSRSLIVKDKAGANTYLTVNSVNIIASTLTLIKYANPEFRIASSAINQNLNQTFYDNGATEKGHIIYAGANSVSNRYFGIFSDAADFLLVATLNNVPMQFWTNSILAMTIGTNQAVTLASSLTTTSVLASVNQNATTLISVSNTDVTNANSRAELRVVGGAISGIMSSIATDALYIGASTNSIVRFISNGAEKFRLNTDGSVTFSGSIIAGSGSSFTTNQNTLLIIGGATDTQIKNAANNAVSLTITDAGVILTRGATAAAGAASGNIVVANSVELMANNAAGTASLGMIMVHSSNRTTINCNSAAFGLNNALTSTTANTGAQTLPAGPQGFITIWLNNGANANKIPYYAT